VNNVGTVLLCPFICVDDDIDIYNLTEVMWAVVSRCDSKDGVEMIRNTMASWLDPSSGSVTGKVFFDATKKEGFRGEIPGYPNESIERARTAISKALSVAGQVSRL
jgi:3-polyprenyl-4-hydroxybenzoate decarboxylase